MSEANQGNIRVPAPVDDNTAGQEKTSRNGENVQEVSKIKKARAKAKWPKTDVRHWIGRVYRNSYTVGGKRFETADYCVKLGHGGRREVFNLGTANAQAAAGRAAAIFRTLTGSGWAAALAEHKPEVALPPAAVEIATIGQLIEAATRLSSARRESLDAYAKALRRIATGALGVKGGKKGPKQGTDAWRQMIDDTPLDKLTPAAVLAWKNAFLKKAANPQERNSAAVTVNSLLRNSKALLSKKVRPFLEKEIVLPSPLWFESVPMEEEPRIRYRSTIDAGTILRAAMEELAPEQPEALKALILTLICGLRRSEADSIQWAQADLEAGTLELMDTEHKALKSKNSAGKIALDAEVIALLRGFKAKTKSAFILETPKLARSAFKEHKSRTYRCDATHSTLIEWLRKHGVNGKRPIHTLRKEIGSIIATREGIFAASRYLRHSDIGITSRLYADNKALVSAGLGALLAPPAADVIQGQFRRPAPTGPNPEKEAKA